jgi:uncharacterized membrane protein
VSTTPQSLPIGDSVSFGWDTFKKWAALLIGLTLCVAFVEGLMETIDEKIIEDSYGDRMEFLWFVALTLVNATLELGMTNVTLKLRDNGRAEFADVFNIFDRVPFFIVALLMVLVIVGIGLILLIIPGIYLAVRLQFVGFRILDGDNPIEALQNSWAITQGHVLELLMFDLLLFGIILAGVLALLVGVLIAVPVAGLALADMYRFLKPSHGGAAVAPQPQV